MTPATGPRQITRLVDHLLEKAGEPKPDSRILAAKKAEYDRLDKEWDRLDNGDAANLAKQHRVAAKMAKLKKDIDRWDKLYAAAR